MVYTLHDFALDFTKEHLHELPPEVRLKGLGPEERLKGLEPEALRNALSFEERLEGLDPGQVEDYLKKLKAGSS